MNAEELKVACIGAGVLGGATIRRLIERGYTPAVWNRGRSKLTALLAAGAVEAGSREQLAKASTFVIACISDDAVTMPEIAATYCFRRLRRSSPQAQLAVRRRTGRADARRSRRAPESTRPIRG